MGFVIRLLAGVFLLFAAIAGATEILGFSIGPLHGPHLVNLWQYGLAVIAACLVVAFEVEDLVTSGKLMVCLFAIPLAIWIVIGFFPLLGALWATKWGLLTQFFSSVALIVVTFYALYLDIRYLFLKFFVSYFHEGSSSEDLEQLHD